jgi:hypothetical protein
MINTLTTVAFTPTPVTVNLTRSCNQVITPASVAGGATHASIAAMVQGTTAVSVFRYNNALKRFEVGFLSIEGAPVDFSTTGPNRSLFICVTGNGTFPTGAF